MPECICSDCLRRIYAVRRVHHLIVAHMQGPADVALAAIGDDGEIHKAVHSALIAECSDEWFAEQQHIDAEGIT